MTNFKGVIFILSPHERETVILFNEGSPTATIFTYNKSWINNLTKKVKEYPDQFKLISSDKGAMEFECPKKYISTPRSPREGRKLSDEEKNMRVEKLAAWREKNSKKKLESQISSSIKS